MASPKSKRGSPPAAVHTWYIESSALLAAFLESDAEAQQSIRSKGRRITSGLTLAESHRAVLRARMAGQLDAEQERRAIRGLETFARRCEIIAVSDEVLVRAGRPFPVEPVRTLDAIHLASVELLGEPPQLVTVVTRNAPIASNAGALGYPVE